MPATREHQQTKQLGEGKPGRAEAATPGKSAVEQNALWQSLAFSSVKLQPKLAISQPDDPYEHEADRIADQVMQMATPPSSAAEPDDPQSGNSKLPYTAVVSRKVQRKCGECQEEEETLQRKEQGAGADTARIVPSRIHSTLRSSGQPLDLATRSFFEPRFGHDFHQVRVHKDGGAAESAQAINARAFTTGKDVFFAAGEYAPESTKGRQLLAHELAHVVQQNSNFDPEPARKSGSEQKVLDPPSVAEAQGNRAAENLSSENREPVSPNFLSRLPANIIARDPPTAVNPQTVQEAVDIIIDALDGYTSRWDSENILAQFNHRDAPMVQAIVQELKRRSGEHDQTPEGMIDWLLGDMTAEDRGYLRTTLIRSRVPDMRRLVVLEIKDRLEGYTSDADSAEIYQDLAMFSGMDLDAVLDELENQTEKFPDEMTDWLFGDLDRSNAERVRQLFFQRGGPRAARYAATFTASKIYSLLDGYTSHSDSTDILWNFTTAPADIRPLVQERLDALTQESWEQSAEDALMEDMDQSDYTALRGTEGMTLRIYDRERGDLEAIVSGLEWAAIVAEWVVCGVVGIVTGILSVVWDLIVVVKDIVVAVWNLIWSLVYLLSGGAAGSSNWLAVKQFFIGIGHLFTNPGQVFDQLWDELALDFHTIEGSFSDCRRAEFIVRKFINAIVNIILIFVAGYGVAKGVASVARGAAEVATLAGEVGIGTAIVRTGGRAWRSIGRFIAVTVTEARGLVQALSRPGEILARIGTRLRVILIAAEDEGYWRYVRRQTRRGVTAARESGSQMAENEREFWRNQREYWRERAARQQQQHTELSGAVDEINENLNQNQAPEQSDQVVQGVNDETAALSEDNALLDQEVTGASRETATGGPVVEPHLAAVGFPPSTPESLNAARRVLAALEESGMPPPEKGTAMGVFYHQDGSVTIGPSGNIAHTEQVQAALQGHIPDNWTVGPAALSPEMVSDEALLRWRSPNNPNVSRLGRFTCSECRLSVGGRLNPSPVEGMSVLQWGGDTPMRFTDPVTGLMRPCESCALNASRIMGPIRVVPRTPPSGIPAPLLIAPGAAIVGEEGQRQGQSQPVR